MVKRVLDAPVPAEFCKWNISIGACHADLVAALAASG